MEAILKVFKNSKKLDINVILFEIWKDPRVQLLVEQLNTEGKPTSQLFIKGQDAFGESFGEYSTNTILRKVVKGQPIDRVTFKDTGDFYETYIFKPLRDGFEVDMDPVKDGENILEKFGTKILDVLGLDDENIEIVGNFITEMLIEKTKAHILQ